MVMNPQQLVLWSKLQVFRVGRADAALPFEARLARENGWTREFADRVMVEYRKFLFLAMHAGHRVTPSEEVDQAWHLHMVYTRSYWHELCDTVLCSPLHHDPTEGGTHESSKFHDCYSKTLASYKRFFGNEPPRDIWPSPTDRFKPSTRKWIDTREVFVISKRFPWRSSLAVSTVALATLIAGCSTHGNSSAIIPLLLGLGFTGLVGFLVLRAVLGSSDKPRRNSSDSGFIPFTPFISGDDSASNSHHHGSPHHGGHHHDHASSASDHAHDAGSASDSSGSDSGCSSGCSSGCGGGGGD